MKLAIGKVISSDSGQVIFLPGEFRLDADEVVIRRSGDNLILTLRTRT